MMTVKGTYNKERGCLKSLDLCHIELVEIYQLIDNQY